jgi:hypothetical protein
LSELKDHFVLVVANPKQVRVAGFQKVPFHVDQPEISTHAGNRSKPPVSSRT